ncbi:uncharacterized protein LOC143612291 [Bidens hawaiensis]|uniref:uncharacterized protein LOC143612291 n=1 Tax=Bidens hawaiensis TaxID=980011 RepID=UPI00404B5A0D
MGDVNGPPPSPAPTKKSNKIRDIVRLQQMLKKWKKAATTTKNNNNDDNNNGNNDNNVAAPVNNNKPATKGLNKFLKKTLSFSDISNSQGAQEDIVVKKGYLAVWVGRDEDAMKKFVIPMDYLAHQAFSVLLRDAEEEFGFQQEGILKIPCDVPLFERILSMLSDNKKHHPTLKSSSSTSSFFLYDQDQQPSSTLKTPPTTPLYCR